MPLAMRKGTRISDVPTELDEEFTQSVFMSWLFEGKNRTEVLARVEKLCKVKLDALRKQSEAIYDVDDYVANAEVDRATAEEAVARSRAAWQKPEPLLEALQTFRVCLDRPEVAAELESTGYPIAEHVQVVDDLIRRVKVAIENDAWSVCLEADAFLL